MCIRDRLTSANTNEQMEKIRAEIAPKLSSHSDKILLNAKLFKRVESVYKNRNSIDLDAESIRLIEKYYKDFVRSGSKLSKEQKERLKSINSKISVLQTRFSQNVLKEVNALAVIIDKKQDLDGLSDAAIQSAADEAKTRDLEGKYVLALKNTSGQPSLSSLTNRLIREKIHKASLSRGSRGGDFDNREVLVDVVKLRAEKARLMGYENHAAYTLETQTAQNPQNVNNRLSSLSPKALANAKRVEVYAFGGSAPVAMDAQHKFFRLKISSSFISDPHIQLMSANSLSKNDVVLAISQSGTTSALIDSVKIVRKSGVKVIGIMPENSPLAHICDYPISINVGDNYRITKPHTSRIAYTAVIDVMTMGIAQLKPEAQEHLYNIVDSQRSLKIK